MAALVGPTACGKSALAVALAARIPLEIISLDSMAVYKHVPIATDLPSEEDRRRVPHHMVNFLEPSMEFSAADYAREAALRVAEIHSRRKLPLFVGGSFFHLRVLMEGLDDMPSANESLRLRHELQVAQQGPQALWNELLSRAPDIAGRLHPHDTRRVSRALEVLEQPSTGVQRRPAIVGATWQLLGLHLERDDIYRRCNQRAERMFQRGLVDEVRSLLQFNPGKTLRQAVGVKEVVDYLEGRLTLEQSLGAVQQATRRLAKHQVTWGKRFDIHWCHAQEATLMDELTSLLESQAS
ncbi:MAG: tRNA (adenosine(37)-N6)-dimethylallyltransferase MiaA [Planctomycetota bacterium]